MWEGTRVLHERAKCSHVASTLLARQNSCALAKHPCDKRLRNVGMSCMTNMRCSCDWSGALMPSSSWTLSKEVGNRHFCRKLLLLSWLRYNLIKNWRTWGHRQSPQFMCNNLMKYMCGWVSSITKPVPIDYSMRMLEPCITRIAERKWLQSYTKWVIHGSEQYIQYFQCNTK